MLGWVIIFFIISIVSGAFGFTRLSEASAGIAEIIFSFFLVLFFVALSLFLVNS
jgi:uncharacterized membrane protein YtjA (UPF0391 family)